MKLVINPQIFGCSLGGPFVSFQAMLIFFYSIQVWQGVKTLVWPLDF